MKFLMFLHIPFVGIMKVLVFFVLITYFNSANATLVSIKIEDAGIDNWEPIQKLAPGFGSSGPISINWDPNKDLFTELLSYDRGYSGGAAAFCWYGENCALQLSVTAENTAINLQSFVLGYYGYGNYVQYKVIDIATQTSILNDSPWVDGNLSSLISVNATSNTGFLILFGPDGFNGGINNITYSYHATTGVRPPVQTPIPSAAWLFSIGMITWIGFNHQSRLYRSTTNNPVDFLNNIEK